MKVCLRHAEQAEAVEFTECGFGDLVALVAMLEEAGVYYNGAVYKDFSHQVVLGPHSAYAEIVLTGEGE